VLCTFLVRAAANDNDPVFKLHGSQSMPVAGPPHLFSLPHRAHAVVEKFGTEGPHTYF